MATKKKAKKKASKKVSKKSVEKAVEKKVPQHILDKQMTGEEMAKLETFFAEMKTSKAEMHTQEQLKKNLVLEKENLELKAQLLDKDIISADNIINEKDTKYRSINGNMIDFIEKLKAIYGVTGNGMIKYDRMSGKIVG